MPHSPAPAPDGFHTFDRLLRATEARLSHLRRLGAPAQGLPPLAAAPCSYVLMP